VPPHLQGNRLPEGREFASIAVLLEPLVHGPERSTPPLLRGLALRPPFARSTPAPVVGAAKGGEWGRTLTHPEPSPSQTCATGQPGRLRRMQAEPASPEPLGKPPQKTVDIVLTLANRQRVLGRPAQSAVATAVLPHSLPPP
jgi:hypothetical protein